MNGSVVYRRRLNPAGEFVDLPVYLIDGVEVSRKAFKKAFPDRTGEGVTLGRPKGWPIVSDALAVHPEQVGEAGAVAARRGVPTEHLPDGRPVLRDRAHRRAYLRAFQMIDRASFTGY